MPGNQYFVVMPMQHCVGIPQSARNPANVSLLFQEFSRLNQGAPALLLSLAQMAPLVFWIGTILGYNSALTVCVRGFDATPMPAVPPCVRAHLTRVVLPAAIANFSLIRCSQRLCFICGGFSNSQTN